jgi:hypothetical protein
MTTQRKYLLTFTVYLLAFTICFLCTALCTWSVYSFLHYNNTIAMRARIGIPPGTDILAQIRELPADKQLAAVAIVEEEEVLTLTLGLAELTLFGYQTELD